MYRPTILTCRDGLSQSSGRIYVASLADNATALQEYIHWNCKDVVPKRFEGGRNPGPRRIEVQVDGMRAEFLGAISNDPLRNRSGHSHPAHDFFQPAVGLRHINFEVVCQSCGCWRHKRRAGRARSAVGYGSCGRATRRRSCRCHSGGPVALSTKSCVHAARGEDGALHERGEMTKVSELESRKGSAG